MRNLAIALLLFVVAVLSANAQQAAAPQPAPAPQADLKLQDKLAGDAYAAETTLQDQTDISVTIYNNDLALVRDRRNVKLLPGELALRFGDVAEKIKPETVSLRSVSAPGTLHILEQNYEFDLMSPEKLMEKYVGKNVRLVNYDNEIGFTEKDAQLLSVNGGPVYKVENQIFLGHPGQVVLPQVPENLIAKPSLIWLLQNDGTDHEIEASYLTNGITWSADYVLTMNLEETQLDIEGWVTLNNQSGAQYANALMKVVAGDVNIAQPEQPMMKMAFAEARDAAGAAPAPMREEAFAEYHLYTLPRRTTIKQNESKQVSLLTAEDAGVRKIYEFNGANQPTNPEGKQEGKADTFLMFKNDKANHLGMPLPAGVMRVYQQDSDGALQFVGEDRIKHTPKDEEIRLKLGTAFDIVGTRVQLEESRISDKVFEAAYEVVIRNHKDKPVAVNINEPAWGTWTVVSSSHEYRKRDANTLVIPVEVPVDGEVKVTYRIRITHP